MHQVEAYAFDNKSGYEAEGGLTHEKQLLMYEEYINETFKLIYDAATFEEFWAGQEKDTTWQGYSIGYTTYTPNYDNDYY